MRPDIVRSGLLAVAAALITLAAAACGGGGGGGGTMPTPPPTATPTPPPANCSSLKAHRLIRTLRDVAPRPPIAMVTHLVGPGPARRMCPDRIAGYMHCNGWIRTDTHPTIIMGFSPAQLQTAYGLTAASLADGASQTIAIVDAYDDPNAEADLGVYRSNFALPACTTANGCFMRVNQGGVASSYPGTDPTGGWEAEESLDLDMASAICPNCEIVLVEASTPANTNFYAAEDTAATLCGATEISNSWDGSEYSGELTDEAHFNHPGVAITVSGGDNGYVSDTVTGTDGYPASSAHVTAVGGTSLTLPSTETVWSGGGSGCSQMVAQPAWQAALGSSYTSVCSMRIFTDVAAVADPNTPVAFYDTFGGSGGCPGWCTAGGTSVAAPIIAGVYALAGGGVNDAHLPYAHTGSFHDITSGNNGTCGATFMCQGKAGYDAPTGVGSPNGIGGF